MGSHCRHRVGGPSLREPRVRARRTRSVRFDVAGSCAAHGRTAAPGGCRTHVRRRRRGPPPSRDDSGCSGGTVVEGRDRAADFNTPSHRRGVRACPSPDRSHWSHPRRVRERRPGVASLRPTTRAQPHRRSAVVRRCGPLLSRGPRASEFQSEFAVWGRTRAPSKRGR